MFSPAGKDLSETGRKAVFKRVKRGEVPDYFREFFYYFYPNMDDKKSERILLGRLEKTHLPFRYSNPLLSSENMIYISPWPVVVYFSK